MDKKVSMQNIRLPQYYDLGVVWMCLLHAKQMSSLSLNLKGGYDHIICKVLDFLCVLPSIADSLWIKAKVYSFSCFNVPMA